ncbi:baseplate assembly protein [Cellulosilyticum sp. WCF-2]|uniref:baseplate assembly protein n=1 Tax=Cellulosilyticum sp. WCF-2 TaxID=2497860 RepID=UPI000F8EBAEB|nr:baseplate J/gp47 family protein [Cellulosilyticum sp. WCF-2]QEH67255.1 baseplate J/gp47 family protein [Cellulosilyticum sp. WCF-2]
MALSELSNIDFCDTSTTTIEADIINVYESLSGKKLYPADPVRLFLVSLAQIIIQQRVIIDFSAKQNLLRYATGEYLDQVVALVGVKRLKPSPARCTLKFTLSDARPSVVSIPKGTRIKAGEVYFLTIDYAQVAAGELHCEVGAECMNSGTIGNDLLPGQISELVDVFPYFGSVTNITTSSGGTEEESDDALRERAFSAPASYSTAGSDEAYAFWAKSVSPEVSDVNVISDVAGEVQIIPIGSNGSLLSQELLNEILESCSAKNVKPLTDKVSVVQPEEVEYNIEATYYISKDNVTMSTSIEQLVDLAIQDYIAWQHSKLGRDINPSELMYHMMKSGIKRLEVTSPTFQALTSRQVAKLGTVQLVYGGLEDE